MLLVGTAVGGVAGALTVAASAAKHEVDEAGGVSVIMRGDDRELDLAAAVLVQWAPTRLERFGPAEEPTA